MYTQLLESTGITSKCADIQMEVNGSWGRADMGRRAPYACASDSMRGAEYRCLMVSYMRSFL